jgi:hypothetical protein
MAKIIQITEHFQHFLAEMKEGFWGDVCGQTRLVEAVFRASWGAPANPAHGLFCECRERGPNHLLHFPEIHPGMENPHPQPIYTSSLTSPTGGRGHGGRNNKA